MRALGLFVQLRQLGRKALVLWTPKITRVTHWPPLAEGPPGLEGWMGRQSTQLCACCQMRSDECLLSLSSSCVRFLSPWGECWERSSDPYRVWDPTAVQSSGLVSVGAARDTLIGTHLLAGPEAWLHLLPTSSEPAPASSCGPPRPPGRRWPGRLIKSSLAGAGGALSLAWSADR